MRRWLAMACLLAGCTLGVRAAEPRVMAPAAAAEWLAATPAAQVLDVRTKEEFATGHLARAVLIPWTDDDFQARVVKELDPKKPVLVYCRSGRRSSAAAAALLKLGFADVRDLAGGIVGWQDAGQPMQPPAKPQ